ncbi:MAG: hypothetical protein ABIN10_12115 [Specibacter sp.]
MGRVAQPAQAAIDDGAVTITSASPTINRPNLGACAPGGASSHHAVIKHTTTGVDTMGIGMQVTASRPVTAILYQEVFMPENPIVNCYIGAWNVPAGSPVTQNRVQQLRPPGLPEPDLAPGASQRQPGQRHQRLGRGDHQPGPRGHWQSPAISTSSLQQVSYGARTAPPLQPVAASPP